MFTVFKQLENGEFAHVGSREHLEQAFHLVEALRSHWPGKYAVRNSQGYELRPNELNVWSTEIKKMAIYIGKRGIHGQL